MLKIIKKRTTLAILPFLNLQESPYDKIEGSTEDIYEIDENLTGMQRLKNLFKPYNNNELHPTLVSIMETSFASFFVGGAYGGIKGSKYALNDFIDKNRMTQFASHVDAKRKLMDNMILSFAKNFAIWGIKVGFFTSSFIIGQTIMTVYQNKTSTINYTVGGMYAGALYKIPLGPKGMVSGAIIGGFFGSLFGGLQYLLYKITNVSEEDITKLKYQLYINRKISVEDAKRQLYLKRSIRDLATMISETDTD